MAFFEEGNSYGVPQESRAFLKESCFSGAPHRILLSTSRFLRSTKKGSFWDPWFCVCLSLLI